jgi:hypothetical protein
MPKLFGLNLVPVLAATVVFFAIGYLWYGVLFADAWMAAEGVTKEQAEAGSPAWMGLGVLITLLQVIGLALVLKWRGIVALTPALTTAGIMWLVFAFAFTLYGFAYLPAHSTTLLAIDAGHLLVGWLVSAGVLAMMKV